MESYFEAASPRGLIGNNLMHEHLHPNMDGYFLMADAFFNAMRREHLICDDWQKRVLKPGSYYRRHWGFTPLDSVYAALTVLHLRGGWPFKSRGPNVALYRFIPVSKEDSVALDILKTGDATLEMGYMEMAGYLRRGGCTNWSSGNTRRSSIRFPIWICSMSPL
jgi:hypothetical protein